MHTLFRTFLLFAFALPLFLFSSETTDVFVDLRNPKLENGIFSTDQGGVVYDDLIRVQAKKISYHKELPDGSKCSIIKASDQLMINYQGRIFIGESFYYDFNKQEGYLEKASTAADAWFIDSDKVEFLPNREILMHSVSMTTCEDSQHSWKVIASTAKLLANNILSARNVRFQIIKLPILWFPFFRSNLDSLRNPAIKYSFRFGDKNDMRLGLRYRVWQGEKWTSYLRFAYHISKGLGLGLDLKFNDSAVPRSFSMENFYAKDQTIDDPKEQSRYRFSGKYREGFREGKTSLVGQYDKTTDNAISRDYYTDDYDIQDIRNSYIRVRNQEKHSIQTLKTQVRVNSFQTIKQEFPSFLATIKPLSLPFGTILENSGQAEYLVFAYAKGTRGINRFSASRMRLSSTAYRPFTVSSITFTPYLGAQGAFYGNSPKSNSVTNYFLRYGLSAKTQFYKYYGDNKHICYPYVLIQGTTTPSTPLSKHYIFDFEDAYVRSSWATLGFRQALYKRSEQDFPTSLSWNLYTQLYLGQYKALRRMPKIYNEFSWQPYPSLKTSFSASWNVPHRMLDLINLGCSWSQSENFAFRCEFEHREPYSWLKANHNDFMLEFARTEEELLRSPLSVNRDTLITHTHLRVSPTCALGLETRSGWKKGQHKTYNEWKGLIKWLLRCQWQIELTYEHRIIEDRFGLNFFLVDGKHNLWSKPPIW